MAQSANRADAGVRRRWARGVSASARVALALGGLAARLPSLLRALAARRPTLARFEEYARGIALTGAAFESEGELEVEGSVVLLVSDLHASLFGTALVARLARGDLTPVDLVLVAGDVTDGGSRAEAQLVVRTLRGGSGTTSPAAGEGRRDETAAPVVLVGGNHDGAAALDALTAAGLTVPELTGVRRAGLRIFGASDPLARSPGVDSDPAALAAQARELAALWPTAGDPDILLVHDVRQAEEVIRLARGRGTPLIVACGNDHRAAVERRGVVTIVNAGTAGASGYGALGRGESAAYTAQLLTFGPGPRPRLRRVTTLSYQPGGRSSVVVEPIDG